MLTTNAYTEINNDTLSLQSFVNTFSESLQSVVSVYSAKHAVRLAIADTIDFTKRWLNDNINNYHFDGTDECLAQREQLIKDFSKALDHALFL